ncbi:MAG: rRNA adenine dimethyltransferase family protein, partial [Candidatus Omnitrophota bacterium]
VHADILDADLCSLTGGKERIIVFGNIPYYISTPVIAKMIEQRECIEALYIVIQEELANRIVSPPGSKEYGAISCFIQFYTDPKKIFRIKRNSFHPRPKVDSCLLKLEMLRTPSVLVMDEELMFKIIRKAFSERRKKIINPLSNKRFMSMDKSGWGEIFKSCGIDESNRAETLSLSDYARLADAVAVSKDK